MGRPLKIAKATLTTLTATTTSTNVVTVTSTANFDLGSRFVAATTVGGITGGTTYFVKSILSGTTLTLSATLGGADLALTTTTGQTVAVTVGSTGTGYDNPTGSSYGVVAGNNGIYGSQLLANVCIAVAGPGTISSVAANTQVYGALTDFANSAPVGSSIVVEGVGPLGFVSSAAAAVAVTATVATGNLVTTTSSTFIIGKPVTLAANIGGLVSGTVYYIESKPNAGNVTLAAYPGGPQVAVSNQTFSTSLLQDAVTLVAGSGFTVSNTAWVHGKAEAGSVLRQKGRSKFLVQGTTSGAVGPCFTANVANAALACGEMNMVATNSVAANVYVERLGSHEVRGFAATDNTIATFGSAAAAVTTPGAEVPAVLTISKV